MEFRNAIFIVTEEHSCPIYNVGEEFMVREQALTVDSGKPVCLMMIRELIKVQSEVAPFESFKHQGVQRTKFECGGCSGLIRFEYKKEKEFATLQMKMLSVSEKRTKKQHLNDFYSLLRKMEIFEPLSDKDLLELAEMLKFKEYSANKAIINKGDRGSHLFIVLSGALAAVGDGNEILGEMTKGDIFGEMSLLSGEPIMTSVFTSSAVTVAILSAKDFKHVLSKYPILQVFFYRLLVTRAQMNTLRTRTGSISSGMTGELAEVNTVELFQLINSGGKTGKIDLLFSTGRGSVLFYEGEIIRASYGRMDGKEALFTILTKSQGTFTYTSGLSDQDKELPVIGGFMGLIMEGLRRIDEEEEDNE